MEPKCQSLTPQRSRSLHSTWSRGRGGRCRGSRRRSSDEGPRREGRRATSRVRPGRRDDTSSGRGERPGTPGSPGSSGGPSWVQEEDLLPSTPFMSVTPSLRTPVLPPVGDHVLSTPEDPGSGVGRRGGVGVPGCGVTARVAEVTVQEEEVTRRESPSTLTLREFKSKECQKELEDPRLSAPSLRSPRDRRSA